MQSIWTLLPSAESQASSRTPLPVCGLSCLLGDVGMGLTSVMSGEKVSAASVMG